MRNQSIVILLTLGLAASPAWAGAFTAGNIVVLRTSASTTGGNPGSLLEFDSSGGSVQTITLPDTGANAVLFGSSSSTLAHAMTRSGDDAWLAIPGYGNYYASIDSATSVNCPRVVALVKYDGTTISRVAASTALSGIITRGGASDGFGNCWVMGASGGTFWMNGSVANSTSTGRAVLVVGGSLYYSTGTAVLAFDEGLPTTSASAPKTQLMTASAMGAGADPAGFAIAPNGGSLAYVANYQGVKGVGRYDWNGTAWVMSYVITNSYGEGMPSIAVDFSQSPAVIYAVGNGQTKLYKFTDPGAAGTVTPTVLASTASPSKFRSVALAPVEPPCALFTTQPANATNDYGSTVTYGPVAATGANPNGYTWMRYGTNLMDGPTGTGSIISGATSNTLTIVNIGVADQTEYYAVAHNSGSCSTTSSAAYLKLKGSCIEPQIASTTVVQGATASFSAGTVRCQAPLSFAWYLNDVQINDGPGGWGESFAGATTATLWITNAQPQTMGLFKVIVTDGNSELSTSIAALTVAVTPYFSADPAAQSKLAGQDATFTATAEGNALSYQWYKNSSAITDGPSGSGSIRVGTQTPTLWITNVSTADEGTYTCTATNLAGTATCVPATLTVGYRPVFTVPPPSIVATGGVSVATGGTVTGTPTISYSWKHNGTDIYDDGHYSGTATATLGIANVQIEDAGSYTVIALNAYGSASATAVVRYVYALPQAYGIPGLVVYDPFNYPPQDYVINTNHNSFQDIISTWNQVTGQPVWWERLGNGSAAARYSGIPYWPGIDCINDREWYWSSAPNNNHLSFGGIQQSSGAAYFSFVFNAGQGAQMDSANSIDRYDTIGGFTSGEGAENADNFVYRLCTHVCGSTGCNTYQLGVFKGGAGNPGASSVNGQWAPVDLYNGAWNGARGIGTHFVVGCYKFNSGTNLVGGSYTNDDVLMLWIDPPTSSFGAAEGNVPTPNAGGMVTNWAPNAPITQFALKGTLPPASRTMTDLRIGTTWASVTHPYYPTIQYSHQSPALTLKWPAKDSAALQGGNGYGLKQSLDLSAWGDAGGSVTQDGTNAVWSADTSAGPAYYYRLQLQ